MDNQNFQRELATENANLQRELAAETTMQLDRHHMERLEFEREQAKEKNQVLTKGLSNIAEALEYIADKDKIQTIKMIGDNVNRLFDLSESDDIFENESKAICRLFFEFNDGADQSMGFEDITSVTTWWKTKFDSGEEFYQEIAVPDNVNDAVILEKQLVIEKLLAITQQLQLYWMSKFGFLIIS